MESCHAQRVSGILCVRHSMRSDYAQTTEDPIGQP